MNIKVLSIVAFSSFILTILLLIFVPADAGNREATVVAENTPTPLPTLDLSNIPTPDLQSPPEAGKAKITGQICFDPRVDLNAGIMLVAESIPSKEQYTKYYYGPIVSDQLFDIEVPPGIYELFTEYPNKSRVALYSQFVICGRDPSRCDNHEMIQIQARADTILRNIQVCDYYWAQEVQPTPTLLPTPSGQIDEDETVEDPFEDEFIEEIL